jgi:TetR/AcrR family transcriptional regulator, fatty acid metabolism regulator protein
LINLAHGSLEVKGGIMSHVRKTREERRVEIAEAALKIVGEYGVQGATMARIAEEVGISGPALYKHFDNRAEILDAALDQLQRRVSSWLDSATEPDALERLRQLDASHISTIAQDYEGVVAPLFEFIAASPRSDLKEQMSRRQRETLQKFIRIIEEGQRQGSIREDIDTVVVAWNLMGLTWMENVAMLEGVDEFITDGISSRILEGILADISTRA